MLVYTFQGFGFLRVSQGLGFLDFELVRCLACELEGRALGGKDVVKGQRLLVGFTSTFSSLVSFSVIWSVLFNLEA